MVHQRTFPNLTCYIPSKSKKMAIMKNKTRAQRTIADIDTNNDEPPTVVSNGPVLGSYCIRATTDLVKNNTEGTISRSYVGYDEYTTIVQKVETVCIRDNKMLGKDTHACINTKLAFMGPMKDCNGRIDITDHVNNSSFTVF